MDKEEFISQSDAPRSVAGRAWEESGGDVDEAGQLIEPVELYINVKFRDSSDRFGGLISLSWDFAENDVKQLEAVVSSQDKVLDVPIDCPPKEFYRRLTNSKKTGEKMGGNTETLQMALEKELKTTGTSLRECLASADLGKVESQIFDLLVQNLDVSKPQLATESELIRKIDLESEGAETSTDGSSREESAEYVFPAEVEIDPVRGVPVSQISIGDLIYVGLGDYSAELQKIAQVLEQRRDDSGLIPAQLTSSEISEAGTLSLRVQFGRGVYGKARCGKDVNILVPESTAADKSQGIEGGGADSLEFLAENWVFIVPVVGVTLIVVAAIVMLSM